MFTLEEFLEARNIVSWSDPEQVACASGADPIDVGIVDCSPPDPENDDLLGLKVDLSFGNGETHVTIEQGKGEHKRQIVLGSDELRQMIRHLKVAMLAELLLERKGASAADSALREPWLYPGTASGSGWPKVVSIHSQAKPTTPGFENYPG